MSLRSLFHRARTLGGFTLAELAVIVVIIGVLAAFAVPRFVNSVERTKAAEAYNYLGIVRAAQERYHARHGRYADAVAKLDTEPSTPSYFTVGTIAVPSTAAGLDSGWELMLTRSNAPARRGAYTVIFNAAGFDKRNSTIPDDLNLFQVN